MTLPKSPKNLIVTFLALTLIPRFADGAAPRIKFVDGAAPRVEAVFGELSFCANRICRFEVAGNEQFVRLQGVVLPGVGSCLAELHLYVAENGFLSERLKAPARITIEFFGDAVEEVHPLGDFGRKVSVRPGRVLVEGEDLTEILVQKRFAAKEDVMIRHLEQKKGGLWCSSLQEGQ